MQRRRSRYAEARAFELREDGSEVFAGTRPRAIGPATGVIEHVVKDGERLDLLAREYYNDDRLWWRIVDANPSVLYGGDLVLRNDDPVDAEGGLSRSGMAGRTILIPALKE